MKIEHCLFIGGPADGVRREVFAGQPYAQVFIISKAMPMLVGEDARLASVEAIPLHEYRRERVRSSGGVDTCVYVYGETDALDALLKGYRNTAPL